MKKDLELKLLKNSETFQKSTVKMLNETICDLLNFLFKNMMALLDFGKNRLWNKDGKTVESFDSKQKNFWWKKLIDFIEDGHQVGSQRITLSGITLNS